MHAYLEVEMVGGLIKEKDVRLEEQATCQTETHPPSTR